MNHGPHVHLQRSIAACAAVLLFLPSLGAPAQQWKAYRYAADGFGASFPAVPTSRKDNLDTKSGGVEMHSYASQSDTVSLSVVVCDYGKRTAGTDPDSVLEGAKSGALANSKSHLGSQKKIALGIYRGIEFEAESDAAHISARFYLVGNTLYQTLVVAPQGSSYSDTVRFLDSFQLIPRVRE